MDCSKVGELLLKLRKEKNMTQKEIADAMNISHKTVSKWERGLGCPDVSLLNELSGILGVNIEKILLGDLDPNEVDGGNMERIKFYACPECRNVMTGTGNAEISCCGRKLTALVPMKESEEHKLIIEEVENDYYITIPHEMSKNHFIFFIAYVSNDRVLLIKLYPEQSPEIRFPKMYGGKLYAFCSKHGLWRN
ncbi:helix-turn-helix domain-containing protein [Oscillospiraceae bacterium PP1C4]